MVLGIFRVQSRFRIQVYVKLRRSSALVVVSTLEVTQVCQGEVENRQKVAGIGPLKITIIFSWKTHSKRIQQAYFNFYTNVIMEQTDENSERKESVTIKTRVWRVQTPWQIIYFLIRLTNLFRDTKWVKLSRHLFATFATRCSRRSCLAPVWPDFAKFRHFGNNLKALVKFATVHLVFG